jgi:RIO-like serine/threonine protein kinase
MDEENRWKKSVQNLINAHGLNFPRLNRYLAGGAYGAIFTTTNGRVLKVTPGNASFEFNALKRLSRTGFVPHAYQKAVVNFTNRTQKAAIMRNLFVNAKNAKQATLYVMNKIDGIQLEKYIKKGGVWGPTEQQRLRKIIHTMHSKGVIHGDFHSQNILVTLNPNGTIKKFYVIDFGQGMFKPMGVRTANVLRKIPVVRTAPVRSNVSPGRTAQIHLHGPKFMTNNLSQIEACVGRLNCH